MRSEVSGMTSSAKSDDIRKNADGTWEKRIGGKWYRFGADVKESDLAADAENVLEKEDFAPRNVKERISIMLDLDLLATIRDAAAETGDRYQTLINRVLRSHFCEGKNLEARIVDAVEQAIAKYGAKNTAKKGPRRSRKAQPERHRARHV